MGTGLARTGGGFAGIAESAPPRNPSVQHTAEKLLAFVAGRGDGKAIAISDGINE
jgi:hypothetical protein